MIALPNLLGESVRAPLLSERTEEVAGGGGGGQWDERKFSVRVSYFFFFADVTRRRLCGEGTLVKRVKQNCLVMSLYYHVTFDRPSSSMTRIPVPLTNYPGSRGPLSKRL